MPSKQIQPLKRQRCSTQSKSETVVLQRRYGIIVYVLIRWEFRGIHCTYQSRDCNYLFNPVLL